MRLLPNLLTASRILLTPYVIWLLLTDQCGLALPVTLFTGLTDAADGYLARRFDAESRIGAIFDPLADKFLLVSLYTAFGLAGLIPSWLAWLVVGRDILILAMAAAGLLFTQVREFPPSVWGKISTVIQIAASLVFLAGCADLAAGVSLTPFATAAVALGTAWSGVHYVYRAFTLAVSRQQKV